MLIYYWRLRLEKCVYHFEKLWTHWKAALLHLQNNSTRAQTVFVPRKSAWPPILCVQSASIEWNVHAQMFLIKHFKKKLGRRWFDGLFMWCSDQWKNTKLLTTRIWTPAHWDIHLPCVVTIELSSLPIFVHIISTKTFQFYCAKHKGQLFTSIPMMQKIDQLQCRQHDWAWAAGNMARYNLLAKFTVEVKKLKNTTEWWYTKKLHFTFSKFKIVKSC